MHSGHYQCTLCCVTFPHRFVQWLLSEHRVIESVKGISRVFGLLPVYSVLILRFGVLRLACPVLLCVCRVLDMS